MTDTGATRVAVYLDFDNIVISRYDQVNGRNSFQCDKTKGRFFQASGDRTANTVAVSLAPAAAGLTGGGQNSSSSSMNSVGS